MFGLRYTEDEVYSAVTNFFGRTGTDIIEMDSEKVTGRLVLEHDFSESTMGFASYTRGFKPGGSNLTYGLESVVAPVVVLPTFDEEIVDAIGDMVVVLTNLAHLEGVRIEHCIESAYNVIKHRNGSMKRGTFVKETK